MLYEPNALGSLRARKCTDLETADRFGRGDSTHEEPRSPTKAAEGSIDVVFDLADPDQARSLQGFRSAFGEDHCEVEQLGHAKVVLKLYPGGAQRLL